MADSGTAAIGKVYGSESEHTAVVDAFKALVDD